MSYIRLQKAMADKGLCSRREAERHIAAGNVKVNGNIVTELGTKVDPDKDHIQLIGQKQTFTTILFHKPRGIMSNCPEPGQKEILDLLPDSMQDLSTIGRLDRDSEGLILLTNDGRLARHYLNTDTPHEREYLVWVNQPLTEGQIDRLEGGVQLSGQETKPLTIDIINPKLIKMTMTEGKNRQIRRMLQKVEIRVTRLKRTRFDTHRLGTLKPGEWKKIR